MAIALNTYGDQTRKEDVTDFVTNLDYTSTPFWSAIGETVATATLSEWLVDTLGSVSGNIGIEGSDATVVDLTQPTRSTNIVQLFRKVVAVSDTESAVAHYGMNDPFVYQTEKNFKELKRDIELAAIQGTRASGSSGVGRQMDGAIALITTNKTARTSGTSLDRGALDDLFRLVFDSGTDSNVDLVLTGSYLKLAIDNISTKVTQNADVMEYRDGWTTQVYRSAFGVHSIEMSRQTPSAAGSAGVLGVDTGRWNKAYLQGRAPSMVPLGKTGSSTKGLVEAEATVHALNEGSSFYASGYFVG